MYKLTTILNSKKIIFAVITLFFVFQNNNYATNLILQDSIKFLQFKGKIIDGKTKKELVFASLTVNNTNISTITNTQGEFILKVPEEFKNYTVTASYLGYTSQVLNLTYFDEKNTVIKLETYIEELSEIKINVKDAKSLLVETLKKRDVNYFSEPTQMTAFYRETIKKRRTYVSLSEAVVNINKQAYLSNRNDLLKLFQARKSTDYDKLDTIALKLRGGPFSTLHLDIMKNPNLIFTDETINDYNFEFGTTTKIDNKPIYVVNFKQKSSINEPLFYGELYIDANSLALTSAKFKLNLENKEKAAQLFIVKKPKKAKVTPIEASYLVNYREKNGLWFYGYSRIELGFKINYDKKLFNSLYYLTMEMAITDWEKSNDDISFRPRERLKSSVILSDEASGFSDPEFWGEYNVIEPEKPIEVAIKKIQKQLKKDNK